MNNNLYDVLEICLQELENGVDVDAVVARYPDLAGELRPILAASVEARNMAVLEPSPEVVRRGRAKLLQRASEMREAKLAPRSRRVIPFFQRIAISFTLTSLFFASGTGLVGASSTALPGENLYTVKLTWENVRLFFTFDHDTHELLEHAFENERLHEINELITEGRHETIQFSGIYAELNAQIYVAGIRVMLTDTTTLPAAGLVNGAAVTVTGRTNAAGFVDAMSIELLPPGSVVPAGKPIKVEDDQTGNVNANGNENDNGNVDENENTNDNVNVNENGNDNGDDNNDNGNDNGDDNNDNGDDNNDNGDDENEDGGGNDNGNTNDDGNDNVNDNDGGGNDNTDDGSNDNDNTDGGGNDNTDDGSNDNTDDANTNDDGNTNDDDSNDDDSNDNDDNSNDDDSNDNDDDNSNDDNSNNGKTAIAAFTGRIREV